MKALITLLAAASIAGCATVPPADPDHEPAQSSSNGLLLLTGVVAVAALAVALSGGGDDDQEDEGCYAVVRGTESETICP